MKLHLIEKGSPEDDFPPLGSRIVFRPQAKPAVSPPAMEEIIKIVGSERAKLYEILEPWERRIQLRMDMALLKDLAEMRKEG